MFRCLRESCSGVQMGHIKALKGCVKCDHVRVLNEVVSGHLKGSVSSGVE